MHRLKNKYRQVTVVNNLICVHEFLQPLDSYDFTDQLAVIVCIL